MRILQKFLFYQISITNITNFLFIINNFVVLHKSKNNFKPYFWLAVFGSNGF